MPKLSLFSAIPIACALVSAGLETNAAAAAQPMMPSTLKPTLQKIYDVQDAGSEKKDEAKMFFGCAPSFVDIDRHGKTRTLAQEKASFEQMVSFLRSVQIRTRVLSVSLKGATATALTTQHVVMTLANPKTGERVPSTVDGTSSDTWIKTADGWRETASRTITEQDTLNGKPYDPSETPAAPINGT